MKIVIPATQDSLTAEISPSFGRAAYFLLVDSRDFSCTVVDNKAAGAEGGAGVVAAQAVVDSGAEALITRQLGQNAADVLQSAGIRLYQDEAGTVKENVKKYCQGAMQELQEIHAGHNHRHGGGR